MVRRHTMKRHCEHANCRLNCPGHEVRQRDVKITEAQTLHSHLICMVACVGSPLSALLSCHFQRATNACYQNNRLKSGKYTACMESNLHTILLLYVVCFNSVLLRLHNIHILSITKRNLLLYPCSATGTDKF